VWFHWGKKGKAIRTLQEAKLLIPIDSYGADEQAVFREKLQKPGVN
jgi:hypothetical protein